MATFYQRITGFEGTVRAYTALFSALDIARALGPAGAARATALEAMIFELERQENLVARATAQRADGFIRGRIANTNHRPRRPSARSGQMSTHVRSEALSGTLAIGQVGIASIEELDKTVNPDFKTAGPYWEAQELGSSAAIGRRLVGYFKVPGSAAPNQADFRQHAYFQYDGRQNKKAPGGIIRRPIPARHFLRDGTTDAVAYWHQQQARVQRDMVAKLSRLA